MSTLGQKHIDFIFNLLKPEAYENLNDKRLKLYHGKEIYLVKKTFEGEFEVDYEVPTGIGLLPIPEETEILVCKAASSTTRKNASRYIFTPTEIIYQSGSADLTYYPRHILLEPEDYGRTWLVLPKTFDFQQTFGKKPTQKPRKPRSDRKKEK